MSNNAPDYKDNLVFEPEDQIGFLKKQLETETFYHIQNAEYIQRIEEKLTIAVKALKEYANRGNWQDCLDWNGWIEDSFIVENGQFGENGYTIAEEALEKIKD